MKIRLADGTEKQLIMVQGGPKHVQGATRDSLSFVFDDTEELAELDSLFVEKNCEVITIIGDDGGEEIFRYYTVRAELRKYNEVVEKATAENPEVTVPRVIVSMAQRTYTESKLLQVADEVTNTQLALCELYEGGIA